MSSPVAKPTYASDGYGSGGLEKWKSIAEDLRRPTGQVIDSADYLDQDDVKLGFGPDNIVVGRGALELNSSDPAVGATMSGDGTEVKAATVKTTTPLEKVNYDGKAFNPQIKTTPPNIVNYYPVVITLPPGILGGLLRGALGAIIALVEAYQESKSTES